MRQSKSRPEGSPHRHTGVRGRRRVASAPARRKRSPAAWPERAELGAAGERLREDRPRDRSNPRLGPRGQRASARTYARCDDEAMRQQSRLFWDGRPPAGLCLFAAAVLSGSCSPSRPVRRRSARRWTSAAALAIGSPPSCSVLGRCYGSRARRQPAARWLDVAPREVARVGTFRRSRIAPQPQARSPRPRAWRCSARHLFLEQRDWLVGPAPAPPASRPTSPTAGAASPRAHLPPGQCRHDSRVPGRMS